MFFRKKTIDRRLIPQDIINDAQTKPASNKYTKKIHDRFYKDFPEKPFISLDREKYTNWLEEMDGPLPHPLISIETMTRFADGLLPGHVYMLYWIQHIHKSTIPAYFEYEYGIRFDLEKKWLTTKGYLIDDTVTTQGIAAIEAHIEIVKKKHPDAVIQSEIAIKQAPKERDLCTYVHPSTPPGILSTSDSLLQLMEDSVREINRITESIRKQMGLPPLKIYVKSFIYGSDHNSTHFLYNPTTKTGKTSKYPLTLHYVRKADRSGFSNTFGDIYYLQNGKIGKTSQIYRIDSMGYFVHLGQTKGQLVVKRVELSAGGDRTLIYKE